MTFHYRLLMLWGVFVCVFVDELVTNSIVILYILVNCFLFNFVLFSCAGSFICLFLQYIFDWLAVLLFTWFVWPVYVFIFYINLYSPRGYTHTHTNELFKQSFFFISSPLLIPALTESIFLPSFSPSLSCSLSLYDLSLSPNLSH